ncbi:MAG: hypothetical protein HMLKMBBP_01459 [Planctomycetes bacterium]|nr:hypothetical protein [Planctomycetota bacterium]
MIAAAADTEMRARVLCVRADADAATELAASIGADVAVVEPGDALLRYARAADGSACLVILVSPQLVADVWPRRTFELIGRSLGNRASALARGVEDAWLRRHAPSLTVAASSAELVTWIARLRAAAASL